MTNLASLLSRFHERYPRRAKGGAYALAGFDLQLRAHLADFAQRLVFENDIESAGQEFLEAFSDYTHQESAKTVCVQVKRTLDSRSMSMAAAEFVVLDEFLETEAPDLQSEVWFEVVSQASKLKSPSAASWDDIVLPKDFEDRDKRQVRLEGLRSHGRLLAPRIEQDPWWRLVATVFPVLDDPLAFAREALAICLGRGAEPADAERARESIVEAFTKRRRSAPRLPGEAVTSDKLERYGAPTREIILGEIPTLAHLRDGRFMERPDRLKQAIEALDGQLAEREWRQEPQIYTLWIDGRSGNGKSVLLLQLMRELVNERRAPAIWLDDASESLLPLLRSWVASPEESAGPWFVFIDDFNAPHKRESIDHDAIARLLRRHPQLEWPVLITCGAPEQHEELKSSGHDDAFQISTWRLPPSDATERDLLQVWFETRTGRVPTSGPAFEQDEGLMVSMVFEMQQGDLTQFGRRFRERLESEGLVEAIVQPLALNRLYIWAPTSWLNQDQGDALRRINQDRDFSVLSLDERPGHYIRLTHPHLSDTIYRAIRARADERVLARDLASAFARSLDTNPELAVRILGRIAESHDRLELLHEGELARRMAAAWTSCDAIEAKFVAQEVAGVWTHWARWTARQPEIAALLGGDPPLERAVIALGTDHKYWGVLWAHLWDCEPGHERLVASARTWLEKQCDTRNRQWSRVWEQLFQYERDLRSPAVDHLLELAIRWLEANEFEVDWNYVFRPLAESSPSRAPWDSAQRLLDTLPTNRNWAYVFQSAMDALPRSSQEQRRKSASLGSRWLAALEAQETDEWSFVWQKLLDCRDDLPDGADVLQVGWGWLMAEEHRLRREWDKIFEVCLRGGFREPQFLEAGVEWVIANESQPQTYAIAEQILKVLGGLDESHPLVTWVKKWLETNLRHRSWTYVWEACWRACPEVSVVNLVLPWMQSEPKEAATFYVARTLAETKRREIIDLLAQWITDHPEERWVTSVRDALHTM